MSVVFLSNRNDPIMFGVYEHLAHRYKCHYLTKADNLNPSIIITNHCIDYKPGQKILFYATNPEGDLPQDRNQRRTLLAWLNQCEVVCASWAIAKTFYDAFRLKPTVQYPYVCEHRRDATSVVYSTNFRHIEIVKNELQGEQCVPLQEHKDVTKAKVYLASSPLLLDLGLCVAAACGVPVVLESNNYLAEFLNSGDVVLDPNTHLNQKIQVIKKSLKEHDKVKNRSNKFGNTSTIEDKIKQALAKKPTSREILPNPKVNNPMSGVRRQREHLFQQVHRIPVAPLPVQINDTTVYISGSVVGISGYDNLVYELTKGLKSVGLDVRLNAAHHINPSICPKYFQDIRMARPNEAWEIVIVPPCIINNHALSKKSIIFTMWETDHLEPEWVRHMNKAAFIIVPSQWAIDSFKKSGIEVPIYKVPLGYDPLIFNQDSSYPIECVFGTAAALTAGGLRKNTSHIVNLFQKAFPGNEKAKLKIKITPSCPWTDIRDKRVEVTKNFLKPMELASWYRSIGAFINCSYAEGFGLHLIETMACGRTIISTKYSAVTEYFDDDVGYVVDHEIVPASGGAYSGHWGKPDDNCIIMWMRHIYKNRDEAMEKGEAAALRARDFTWKNTGRKLIDILKENGVIKL